MIDTSSFNKIIFESIYCFVTEDTIYNDGTLQIFTRNVTNKIIN